MTTTGSPPGCGFEQYTGEVYGWAYRLLGRHHDALDVVQDVFLRWDAQCARQAPQRPRGWLRRVTLNRAIDLRRQRQTTQEPQALACADSAQAETGGPSDVGTRIDQEILRDDITVALDRLSEIQRGVLVAKVYDEMTFAEIATELNLALSTVKTHYLRAVRTVRDRLQRRWA
ncbi:MAG: RNA polymerase sigma factor [Phycisphaerae bacterium]